MIKKIPIIGMLAFLVLVLITFGSNSTSDNTAHAACQTSSSGVLSWYTLGRVNENKDDYIAVSNATNVPWELLASIHYRETNFSRSNPSNGQGIFQFVSGAGGPYPTGPVSDAEFIRQLTFVADAIQNDYVYRGNLSNERKLRKDNEDSFRIKDVLFSYNGRASVYAQQAANYGYNSTTEPYEGSPYVMNGFDCARAYMGIITQDFGSLDGIDTRHGAYTVYSQLISPLQTSDIVFGDDFNAGRLIDDSVFSDKDSMSVAQIQSFFQSEIPTCDPTGAQQSEFSSNGETRAQFAAAYGEYPPFRCVKDYLENPVTGETNLNTDTPPAGGMSAAQIIWDAAQANDVNPRVLISLMQAQRQIIADEWPWNSQYSTAAGLCRFSTTCDPDEYGFYNQANDAAALLKAYANPVNGYTYNKDATYNIAYNVSSVCGSAPVTIKTNGTAALYNYEPFQPNPAALSNVYSSGDSCSTNENRDFWVLFNNWFGDTRSGECLENTVPGFNFDVNFYSPANTTTDRANIVVYSSTGSNCIEIHTWTPSYQQWLMNQITHIGNVDPSNLDIVFGDTNGDDIDEAHLVVYNSTGSGTVEIHRMSDDYKSWITNLPTAHGTVDKNNARVVFGDVDGDNVDEAHFVKYANTGSGKIEIHRWAPGYQSWVANYATTHDEVSVADTRVVFGDVDGDNVDEAHFVKYANTGSGKIEIHRWAPGYQSWVANYATTHDEVSVADTRVVFGDVDGDNVDEAHFVKYANTGSGKIEIHRWAPGYQSWVANYATQYDTP